MLSFSEAEIMDPWRRHDLEASFMLCLKFNEAYMNDTDMGKVVTMS